MRENIAYTNEKNIQKHEDIKEQAKHPDSVG